MHNFNSFLNHDFTIIDKLHITFIQNNISIDTLIFSHIISKNSLPGTYRGFIFDALDKYVFIQSQAQFD